MTEIKTGFAWRIVFIPGLFFFSWHVSGPHECYSLPVVLRRRSYNDYSSSWCEADALCMNGSSSRPLRWMVLSYSLFLSLPRSLSLFHPRSLSSFLLLRRWMGVSSVGNDSLFLFRDINVPKQPLTMIAWFSGGGKSFP